MACSARMGPRVALSRRRPEADHFGVECSAETVQQCGMVLNPEQIPSREKLILAGLFLSKYDAAGLKKLGFESFLEAFNVIGYALGAKPASIKNYRDEFDPLISKRRKGWHKRPTREYCLGVFRLYGGLDFETFTGLIRSFVGYDA